jgi:hypothetical protein
MSLLADVYFRAGNNVLPPLCISPQGRGEIQRGVPKPPDNDKDLS